MELAVVKSTAAPLYAEKGARAPLAGELLYGMTAELLENAGDWLRLRAGRQGEGWAPARHFAQDAAFAREWEAYGKMAARAPFVDVMEAPDEAAACLATLPRGGLLHPLGAEDDEGWLPVGLAGGGSGYVKSAKLMPQLSRWQAQDEKSLREALAATAMSYLGSQYRLGGSTPAGIDSGGLVFMAYRLNGAAVPRAAKPEEGYDTHAVEPSAMGMGDLLYFGGHAALYLGDGMYIHSTPRPGSDGVVLNSLRPDSPFYREDLPAARAVCHSLF